MKARIKATGDIIEIDEDCSYVYAKNYDKSYALANLEFLDIKENENPDYWEKLKHQYAGIAMQGIMANQDLIADIVRKRGLDEPIKLGISDLAIQVATALVNKLKESKI